MVKSNIKIEPVFFRNKAEWRDWLNLNHKNSKEIWLVYYKKHTKKESISYVEAVEEALCFGWIDSTVRSLDEERYMQKYTPRNEKSIWSLLNKKRVEKLIKEKRMTKAGIEKVEIAKRNGNWDNAYTSQKEAKMPDSLLNELKKNKKAWKNFNEFANSYQNIYIGWVLAAKRPETREKRIAVVIERSEKNIKPGML